MRQRANDDGGPGYLRTSLHRKFPREFIMAKKHTNVRVHVLGIKIKQKRYTVSNVLYFLFVDGSVKGFLGYFKISKGCSYNYIYATTRDV